MSRISLIGAPVDSGQRNLGCLMGPDAYRVAGIEKLLTELGHEVRDLGNLSPGVLPHAHCDNPAVDQLDETLGWTKVLRHRVAEVLAGGRMPVTLGGDHSLALGSVAGAAEHATRDGRPLFLMWLDAHSDFHTPMTTVSGNLHGTPVAYIAGRSGFDAFPPFPAPIPAEQICLFGIRSVDTAEQAAIRKTGITVHDMRVIDEHGVAVLVRTFIEKVRAANGLLHVSFDVDFLEPDIAPAVSTTVPGGATFREAHLIMEMLHDSGFVTSLDIVELNPFLDERGKTAKLLVDLVSSLMGKRVMDRPTLAG